jgi:hypothetical protein
MLQGLHRGETLPEFVGVHRIVHLGLGQMTQQKDIPTPLRSLRIVNPIDGFAWRGPQPIQDAEPAQDQTIQLSRLQQSQLIEGQHSALQQDLPQGPALAGGLLPEHLHCLLVHQLMLQEHFAQLTIPWLYFLGGMRPR